MAVLLPIFRLIGDRGLFAEFEDRIDPEVYGRVRHLVHLCRQFLHDRILEVITGYRSFLIIYDPLVIHPEKLQQEVLRLKKQSEAYALPPSKVIEIPVRYGGEWGPDLEYVARSNGLSTDEVVRLHCSCEYMIYMSGFTPGFPMLGGLSPQLWTPRRETPRTAVPAGSVGIGNRQTGIYPFSSPGGWQLIGRTDVRLFDPDRDPMVLYRLGDRIQFRSITAKDPDSRGIAGHGREGLTEYRGGATEAL